MKTPKRPEKESEILLVARQATDRKLYRHSEHALLRHSQRNIRLDNVIHVLKTGYREPKKDVYDENFKTWKYSIRGNSLEDEDLRIIIAFADGILIIVTVMYVA